MYAGTTFTPLSGRLVGAHQKIDRLARTSLQTLLGKKTAFPPIRKILHFEGVKGPDAIKRKSPAKDEPWHYYSPLDDSDMGLLNIITNHYKLLVDALRAKDEVRTAFEAAWLAHALVDGLTPAHHFPYEEKLSELRGGASIGDRTTFKKKLVMPGETRRKQVHNNWKMWGAKGLFTTHYMFEWGIAAIILPLRSKRVKLSPADIEELRTHGLIELFRRKAKEVSALGMYERFYHSGWTPKLAREVRRQLLPTIVQMVTLAWYAAALEANGEKSAV